MKTNVVIRSGRFMEEGSKKTVEGFRVRVLGCYNDLAMAQTAKGSANGTWGESAIDIQEVEIIPSQEENYESLTETRHDLTLEFEVQRFHLMAEMMAEKLAVLENLNEVPITIFARYEVEAQNRIKAENAKLGVDL